MGKTVQIFVDALDGHGYSSTSLRLEASSEMKPRALRPDLDRAKTAHGFAAEIGKPATGMVLRLKPSKPSISTWAPRDLSDAGNCRTSRRALAPSSRSCTPTTQAAYLTRHHLR